MIAHSLIVYVPGAARVAYLEEELKDRDHIIKNARIVIKKTQDRMKQIYDSKHREKEFSEGDMVYLKLQPYRQLSLALRKNLKLSTKFYGLLKLYNE